MAYSNIICCEIWRLLLTFVLTIPLLFVVNGEPKVPCFFIFGDSLADNGNNNIIPTFARANYPPYGIDFPSGATGRFTNNRTTVDLIAELLGFQKFIPPFATAINNGDITSGVNYASASTGILFASGTNGGDNVNFNEQLREHRITISRLRRLLGTSSAIANHLNKCLYSFGFGSNDYLNNYFLPFSPTSTSFTPRQFANGLVTNYYYLIRTLYLLGARKMVVNGLGPIGCTPYAINRFGNNESPCVDRFNDAAKLFNAGVLSLVDQLNNELAGAKIIYADYYEISSIADPGLKVINKTCCPTVFASGLCIFNGIPCENRSEYSFYDEFHPTHAANLVTAARSYSDYNASFTYPYDISHLVAS